MTRKLLFSWGFDGVGGLALAIEAADRAVAGEKSIAGHITRRGILSLFEKTDLRGAKTLQIIIEDDREEAA
ncbi:hypothetical protein [Methylocella tundrae]|uniref:Uncharacterized protein n=1 Tax=Methylocella tundrae TaxID=227605 RepID=A0A4U8YYK5_METTU|nr:hypothetical protein [Methylocella tundrae]WPP05473.1 hypothetical protein SIN04_06525 [Methylocella tundrae]VFU07894.1 protein of unknown function [Methylocella tundrae]